MKIVILLSAILTSVVQAAEARVILGAREEKVVVSDGRRGGGALVKQIHVLYADGGVLHEMIIPTKVPAGPDTIPRRMIPEPRPISIGNGTGDLKPGDASTERLAGNLAIQRLLSQRAQPLGIRRGTSFVSDGRRGGGQSITTTNIMFLTRDALVEVIVPEGGWQKLGDLRNAKVVEHKLSPEAFGLLHSIDTVLGVREGLRFEPDGRRGGGTSVFTVNILVRKAGRDVSEIVIPMRADAESSLNVDRISSTQGQIDPIGLREGMEVLGSREGSRLIGDGRRGGGFVAKTMEVMILRNGVIDEISIPIVDDQLRFAEAEFVPQGPLKIQARTCEGLF